MNRISEQDANSKNEIRTSKDTQDEVKPKGNDNYKIYLDSNLGDKVYSGFGQDTIYANQSVNKKVSSFSNNEFYFNSRSSHDVIYMRDIKANPSSETIDALNFEDYELSEIKFVKKGNDLILYYDKQTDREYSVDDNLKYKNSVTVKDCFSGNKLRKDFTIVTSDSEFLFSSNDYDVPVYIEGVVDAKNTLKNLSSTGSVVVNGGELNDKIDVTGDLQNSEENEDASYHIHPNKGNDTTIINNNNDNIYEFNKGDGVDTIDLRKGNLAIDFSTFVENINCVQITKEGKNAVINIYDKDFHDESATLTDDKIIIKNYFNGNNISRVGFLTKDDKYENLRNIVQEDVVLSGNADEKYVSSNDFEDIYSYPTNETTIISGNGDDDIIKIGGKDIVINSANGNDHVIIKPTGIGDGHLENIPENATVRGGNGNDTIAVAFTRGDINIDGGAGRDRIVVETIKEPSDKIVTVHGGAGGDRIDCAGVNNKTEIFMDSSKNETEIVRGGSKEDRVYGSKDSTGHVQIFTGEGNDTVYGGRAGSGLVDLGEGNNVLHMQYMKNTEVMPNSDGDYVEDKIYLDKSDKAVITAQSQDKIYGGNSTNANISTSGAYEGTVVDLENAKNATVDVDYRTGKNSNIEIHTGRYNNNILIDNFTNFDLYLESKNDVLVFKYNSSDDLKYEAVNDKKDLLISSEINNKKVVVKDYFSIYKKVNPKIELQDGTFYLNDILDVAINEAYKMQNGEKEKTGTDFNDIISAQDITEEYGVNISSGKGNDTVTGTNYNDTINLGEGNNSFRSYDGDDYVVAANGDNDINIDGDGNNKITVGNGNNTIKAGTGTDSIVAGIGDNNITTYGDGNSTIKVGHGNNSVFANNGNNKVTVGNGDNKIHLKNGDDTLSVGNGDNEIYLDEGNSIVKTGNGDNEIHVSGNGNNTITTGKGDDSISASGSVKLNDNGGNLEAYLYSTEEKDSSEITIKNGKYIEVESNNKTKFNVNADTIYSTLSVYDDTITINAKGKAITDSGNGNDKIDVTANGLVTVKSQEGNDTINAKSNSTILINVGTGDNIVTATTKADVEVRAQDGNDDINISSAESATIYAGGGSDKINSKADSTYIELSLDGKDTIDIYSASKDKMADITINVLDNNIKPKDVKWEVSGNDLAIIDPTNSENSITLQNYMKYKGQSNLDNGMIRFLYPNNPDYQDRYIYLEDLVILNGKTEGSKLTGTFLKEVYSFNIGDGNKTLNLSEGRDVLEFNLLDNLDGQKVDDLIAKENLFTVKGKDLIVNYTETDSVTIKNYFGNTDSNKQLSSMHFKGSDGKTIEVVPENIVLNYVDSTVPDGNILIDMNSEEKRNLAFANQTEKIKGTEKNDVIKAVAGYDTIYGEAGNDKLYAGTSVEGNGNHLYGGEGNDSLYGSNRDVINIMFGEDGNDKIYGGQETGNIMFGGKGNDTLYTKKDSYSYLYAGSGDDIIYSNSDAEIYAGSGKDTVYLNDKDSTLVIGSEDKVYGREPLTNLSNHFGFELAQDYQNTEGDITTVYVKQKETSLSYRIYDYETIDDLKNNLVSTKEGKDLILSFKDSDKKVIIKNHFKRDLTKCDDKIYLKDEYGKSNRINVNSLIISQDYSEATKGQKITSTLVDSITGSNYNDNIKLSNGNHIVNAGEGADTIYAGKNSKGNITINDIKGGKGNDKIYTYDGDDTINGGEGNDSIYLNKFNGEKYVNFDSNFGEDTIYRNYTGGEVYYNFTDYNDEDKFDENAIFNRVGSDLVLTFKDDIEHKNKLTIKNFFKNLNSSKDYISYRDSDGLAVDFLNEHQFIADYSESKRGVTDKGTNYSDKIIGSDFNDNLNGGKGNDEIIGGKGNDKINGGVGQNSIVYRKGDGNDTIYSGKGKDSLIIESNCELIPEYKKIGNDMIITFGDVEGSITVKDYYKGQHSVERIVSAFTGNNIILPEGVNPDIIVGTDGNDSIVGNNLNNNFILKNGNDTLETKDGNNYVIKNSGNATITAGNGDDYIDAGEGNLIINGGDGNKTIQAMNGLHNINLGDGNNTIILSMDIEGKADTITLGNGNNDLKIQHGKITTGSGNDSILTDTLNDTINAGDGDNTIESFGGDNSITSGSGDDSITVGRGNNTISAGIGNNTIDCAGGNQSITTESGDDSITVGLGNSTINAGDGDNTIESFGGDNSITSGGGDDSITVGKGNNTISAGIGNNTIDCAGGNQSITTESGDDSITVGLGNSTIIAGDGQNIIRSRDGNQSITSGTGDDSISVGKGDNTIDAGNGNNVMLIKGGTNSITAGNGNDFIDFIGNSVPNKELSNNTINLGDGHNTIALCDGNQDITTGSGNDLIDLRNGNSKIAIGDGVDIVDVNDGDVTITGGDGDKDISLGYGAHEVTLGNGNNKVRLASSKDGSAINKVNLGNGDNNLIILHGNITTGSGNDSIFTDKFNDTINAGDGDNIVKTVGGNNSITTGMGNDSIFIEKVEGYDVDTTGNNTINAGEGNNTITFENGNQSITSGSGNDSITIGNGNSTIEAGDGDNTITAGDGLISITTGAGADSITTGTGDDIINAGDGNNTIYANYGNNSITTGNGNDSIEAGYGNNTINAADGDNTISLQGDSCTNEITVGLGNDSIIISSDSNNLIELGEGNNTLDAYSSNNTVTAGNGDNYIAIGGGANSVTTGSGSDTIKIFADDSTINAGDGNNLIDKFYGSMTITTGNGNDTITADSQIPDGHGNNNITSGDGNDSIVVYDGNDTITVGNGNNTISSGAGNDVINALQGTNSIYGGLGDDTYNLSINSTQTTITENVDGGNDVIKLDSLKDNTIIYFDNVAKDKLSITSVAGFKTKQANIVTNDFSSVERIETSDGYYTTTTQLNTVSEQVTAWLVGKYDNVEAVLNSGNDGDIDALKNIYAAAWKTEGPIV